MLKILFFLFIVIPLLELYVLIEVGAGLGGFSTIALCLFTAALGGILIRWQGLQTLLSAQKEISQGHTPEKEALHGFLLVIAGVCLFLPGFITDTIGFLLLIPMLRESIVQRVGMYSSQQATVIDVEIIEDKPHIKH